LFYQIGPGQPAVGAWAGCLET